MLLTKNIAVLGFLVLAAVSLAAAQDVDVDEFNEAYNAYKRHAQSGEYTEAAAQSARAASIGATMYGDNSAEAATLTFNHGVMLRLANRTEDARDVLRDALSRYEVLYGKRALNVVLIYMDLGRLALDTRGAGNVPTDNFDLALSIAGEHYGKASADLGELQLEVGTQIVETVIDSAAIPYLESARENLRRANGPNDESAGLASYQLGQFYIFGRRFEEALPYLQEALATHGDPNVPTSIVESRTHSGLVRAYEATGNASEAARHTEIMSKYGFGADETGMVAISRVAPRYPVRALAARSEGAVVVRFTVDEQGMVQDPEVLDRVGHVSFEQAAIDAVSQFRYAPRKVDGVPISVDGMTTTIRFRIEN